MNYLNTLRRTLRTLVLLTTGLTAFSTPAYSLPLYATAFDMEGVLFYLDSKQTDLAYYVPVDLRLARKGDGQPELLLMRTIAHRTSEDGTNATSTSTAVLRFTLERSLNTESDLLRLVRQKIPTCQKVRPLPMTGFRLQLIDGREKVGTQGEPAGELGRNEESGNWHRRSFTVALTREASTLFLQQTEVERKVHFRIGYDYRSTFFRQKDSVLVEQTAAAGTIAVTVDANRWAEVCFRDIVVNDAAIPRYLPFSVSCYDFSEGIRPDLLTKSIEITAQGISGKPVTKFLEFSPVNGGQTLRTSRFPGPVATRAPLRYRILELMTDGREKMTSWREAPAGSLIDITTPLEERLLRSGAVEMYADGTLLETAGYSAVRLEISYELLGEPHEKVLRVATGADTSFRTASFLYDKTTPPVFTATYERPDGSESPHSSGPLTVDFMNLSPIN